MIMYTLLVCIVFIIIWCFIMGKKALLNAVANSPLYYYVHLHNVSHFHTKQKQHHASSFKRQEEEQEGSCMIPSTSFDHDILDGAATVITIPFLKDNYAYILMDKHTGECAVVDPADPKVVMHVWHALTLRWQHQNSEFHTNTEGDQDFNKTKKAFPPALRLKYVLTTHKHFDHAGGNLIMKSEFPPVIVVGGILDSVQGATKSTWHKDVLPLGKLIIETLALPCHTVVRSIYIYVSGTTTRCICIKFGAMNNFYIYMTEFYIYMYPTKSIPIHFFAICIFY
jgi:hypothetical protein